MPRSRFSGAPLGLGLLILFVAACGDPSEEADLETDASAVQDGGASGDAGADPDSAASVDAEALDAEALDAEADGAVDADQVDEDAMPSCAADEPADACGVCGGDGTSCAPHPLAGTYAVRTQLYARQKTFVGDPPAPLDLVTKAVLLSVADIDEAGVVDEHYCFLELGSSGELPVYSWTEPTALETVADTTVALVEEGGVYVRPVSVPRPSFSWSEAGQPDDCVPGEAHSSGCICGEPGTLPSASDDCRVSDADEDGVPGGGLLLDLERPADLASAEGLIRLSIVASIGLEWRLSTPDDEGNIVGDIEGGFEQRELSRASAIGDLLGPVENAVCPAELGRVELIKGDFDCAAVMAGRVDAPESHGIFHPELDAPEPALEVCPDPGCGEDSDGDGTPDCRDECIDDGDKTEPLRCGCGQPETDADGDGAPDCVDACPASPKSEPGQCGCDAPDDDRDGDGTVDCLDACPDAAGKTEPLVCGCDLPELDSDGDGSLDCVDDCVNDAAKLEPGLCGCGLSDADSDGDGVPDCNDACPGDANKTSEGICGCNIADIDADQDGVYLCDDDCDSNPEKTAPGACGCGRAETGDADGDGEADCNDACPSDAAKTTPGACGCGEPDTDTDGDGAADCSDACSSDPGKTAPGVCGCGTPDVDADADGTLDCVDACKDDPAKSAPGACGCGRADVDSDRDGVLDCREDCPADPLKVAPGQCGCGVPDTDLDGNGSVDCADACPSDPQKAAPGLCGCGVADTNRDGDSEPDCLEECDDDPNKLAPGACGCGVADTNRDGDAQPDCLEECDDDPNKLAPGACGCGVADTDSDGDGVPDCSDGCVDDPDKTTQGLCGCGVPETDTDADGALDCDETCDTDPNKREPGQCGCGESEMDSDADGTPDCNDACPSNPNLTAPGECGCEVCVDNPLLGQYAIRTSAYSKSVIGDQGAATQRVYTYSLVSITEGEGDALDMTQQVCWTYSAPHPDVALAAYSWSKASVLQAAPPARHTLFGNGDGSWSRPAPPAPIHVGWNPARQPAACNAGNETATPLSPWPFEGGSCQCASSADVFPAFDTDASGFDCRVDDPDQDGLPGLTAYAGQSLPTPEANPHPLLGATIYAVSDVSDDWLIQPSADGFHTATIAQVSTGGVVGCTGLPCSALGSTAPLSASCPRAVNRAQFVPVTAATDTCGEILDQRNTLFDDAKDAPWPDDAACPPP